MGIGINLGLVSVSVSAWVLVLFWYRYRYQVNHSWRYLVLVPYRYQYSISISIDMEYLAVSVTVWICAKLLHTFWYFVLFCPVLDPLLPGLDVPDPDGADGDQHQEGKHEDAHKDGDDHVSRISWNARLFMEGVTRPANNPSLSCNPSPKMLEIGQN